MIKAVITPEGISVTGHAPGSGHIGYNDICVAVSALTQVLVLEAKEHAHADVEILSDSPGDFRARFGHLTIGAVTLISALAHGIEWISGDHPGAIDLDAAAWRLKYVF